jgi:hypothetical protein
MASRVNAGVPPVNASVSSARLIKEPRPTLYAPNGKVIWSPQPGSQGLFLSCPVYETLYEGTRGPGKTDALLMDFAQFVGRGFGENWRGILFRRYYKDFEDLIARSRKYFPRIFPGARFLESQSTFKWRFPDGAQLLFRHGSRKTDYWSYHGHQYPWIGWEELTAWADPELYDMMKACCRSTFPGMPRHYRSTTNPWGPGHGWVKDRFISPAPRGHLIHDSEGIARVAIRGVLWENRILIETDPEYVRRLLTDPDPNRRAAWVEGSWDITSGGMFDSDWREADHVIQPFEIPKSWYVDRAFDWGSSAPFSVGWWAESDGTDATLRDGTKLPTRRGDLFRIAEWYGWTGTPNKGLNLTNAQIARGIKEREAAMGLRVLPGPADTQIFTRSGGQCIADDMLAEGVDWLPANKATGTRKNGWQLIRQRLDNVYRPEGPRLFVFNTCRQFIRTFPVLSRDEKDPDDVNSKTEDHIADETRYRVLHERPRTSRSTF